MSLRSRIASLLVALSIVLVAIMYAAQVLVVMPTFVNLERDGAERNVSRCTQAIDSDLRSISDTTNDWASWDDTYQYIRDHNAQYAKANLVDESFSNTHLNLMCFLDQARHIVWGEVRDVKTLEKIDVPDLFAAIQNVSNPISSHRSVDDVVAGILLTSKGPMLLASRPIITTKRKGPIRGSLIMGRFLNKSAIDDLANRTQVKLKAWTIDETDIPAEAQRIVDTYPVLRDTHIETVDEEILQAYRTLDDIYGRPAMLLQVDVPRDITAQGKVAARVAGLCSLLGGGVTLAVMWIVLQRGVAVPLHRMAAHLVHVGQSGDLKSRLNLSRSDEIGTLANEFDRMVEKLAEYRKKVLDTAHRSGMEEVASEVLHNVGNAVNSANCSVEMLRARIGESKVAGFDRAAAMLREYAPRAAEFFGNDPRGPKLLDYLVGLNDALQQENNDQRSEVDRLFETIRHIRDVVTAQQAYTGQSEFRQEVDLSALVDEALLLNQDQLLAQQIEVKMELPSLPELLVNKSKMTQVLVNLIRNAIQAMQGQEAGTRRLTIVARVVDESGIEIEIRDTGTGFNDDVKAKLFSDRFTTKPNGNGFGLHYCANVVQAAGGQISAESPGRAQGATFRIRLLDVMPKAAALTCPELLPT